MSTALKDLRERLEGLRYGNGPDSCDDRDQAARDASEALTSVNNCFALFDDLLDYLEKKESGG